MPLIARDYWVSNFFGNTMYLLAFGYYFVITFLGYNGMHEKPVQCRSHHPTNNHSSLAFPEPDRSSPSTRASARHHLVHQLVHIRLRHQPCAGLMVWRESSQSCVITETAENCFLHGQRTQN